MAAKSNSGKPRRREAVLAVIPNLVTLGNLVCGFAAITKAAHGQYVYAAWLVFLGMVFDAFDGTIARLTHGSSDFGAELDSLSDAVSFGIAPAFLVASLHQDILILPIWPKAVWAFSLLFAVCAVLRLARFNVENEHGEEHHQFFKGLPSPAAAGAVASLVLLRDFVLHDEHLRRFLASDVWRETLGQAILGALPFVALIAGYLMVSGRLRYVHLGNRLLRGRKTFDYFRDIFFAMVLGALIPELSLAAVFCGFALSGPLELLRRRGKPAAGAEAAAS